MKKILGLLAIVLGLTTGCSMNVAPVMEEQSLQNVIQWVENNNRAAKTTLDYVTVEVYKVPIRNNKYVFEEKEFLETKELYRGEKLPVKSIKDYNYKYVSYIRVVEFGFSQVYGCDTYNEINFFDYEDTTGMETVHYYGCSIDEKDGWKHLGNAVYYIDSKEGYTNIYNLLNEDYLSKFYEEHKDGGRIIWNN